MASFKFYSFALSGVGFDTVTSPPAAGVGRASCAALVEICAVGATSSCDGTIELLGFVASFKFLSFALSSVGYGTVTSPPAAVVGFEFAGFVVYFKFRFLSLSGVGLGVAAFLSFAPARCGLLSFVCSRRGRLPPSRPSP